MEIFRVDRDGYLYLSPDVDDWDPIEKHHISAVIDLDGDLDIGVPTVPNHLLYIYFPIIDRELPDLEKLHSVARMGSDLINNGYKVLAHCGLGFNRSALMAGLILTYMGMDGSDAVELLREKRPGALFNEEFATYLERVKATTVY